jgi:8-oxo-dGTP pyrophosphatase MutT (NUDIX family)
LDDDGRRRWHDAAVTAELEEHPAIPAATVVLARDADAGVEVLMLHRVSKVAFGGMWVFPGGRVDDGDRQPGDDEAAAARRAAAREAMEECGLAVEPGDLVPFAHWVPPAITPRRFSTHFFLARASDGDVVVDGGEIHEHEWLAAGEVLARRDRGEVDLAPPTWVTLHDLAAHATVDDALVAAAARDPLPHYVTRWVTIDDGAVAMWAGDAGYDAGDPDVPGGRHRLWMVRGGWRLERT